MKIIRFIFFAILLAISVCWTGCVYVFHPSVIFQSHTDPLADWQKDYGKIGQSIVDDYQNYIQKLSPKEKKYLGIYGFYEDGTGQHAVKIEVDIDGKDCWYHILFYDKDNKRIKAIKYYNGRYQS